MRKYNQNKIKARVNIPIVFHKRNSDQPFVAGTIDYKNLPLLRQFISAEGKILPRRLTGLNAKQQRKMATAIKTARVAGLLVFINQ
uniref:Small ribosomal subunit protein bS18c n=1 Tax=Halochlorococcum sp. NIES-1838 TaxID=2249730 RepID=A0A2Z4M9Z9_9CHLO|nr:ribosomal protein S18 [Halochlorococcum sp. NIES-1838]